MQFSPEMGDSARKRDQRLFSILTGSEIRSRAFSCPSATMARASGGRCSPYSLARGSQVGPTVSPLDWLALKFLKEQQGH